MKPVRIAHPEKCSGCGLCQLVCSFFQSPAKQFQPSAAYIHPHRINGANRFEVRILPECVQCGLCASYCEYGVLEK